MKRLKDPCESVDQWNFTFIHLRGNETSRLLKLGTSFHLFSDGSKQTRTISEDDLFFASNQNSGDVGGGGQILIKTEMTFCLRLVEKQGERFPLLQIMSLLKTLYKVVENAQQEQSLGFRDGRVRLFTEALTIWPVNLIILFVWFMFEPRQPTALLVTLGKFVPGNCLLLAVI